MYNLSAQSLIALILVVNLSLLSAATPAIGVVVTHGSFTIDNAKVTGNATLFEGNTIETGVASSKLELNGGARMYLASESRGKIFRDHVVLQKGAGQFDGSKNYEIEALSLRIAPLEQSSSARVELRGSKVQVAALNGPVRVANANGVVVANLAAGNALSFTPQQAGAAAPTSMTGCLAKMDGRYVLRDETSNVTVELQGSGLNSHVGHRVEISGSMVPTATPAEGATQVINVTNLRMISTGCTSPIPGAAGAGTAGAGAGAAAGHAGLAVIAGVVVAGGVIATAVALARSEEAAPLSPLRTQ